ncbi:MAG TPA: transketolase [Chitinophagaceae bacterium]|nr:transketolase [Chitinophagaceae bacterium]
MTDELTQLCINTVRVLSADAVQKANSGHPGTPMALAPVGHVLWTKSMHYNPQNPEWPNRDRFILSAGHACMLQYSYLFLTGYNLTLDDIKKFRQLHSKTAGHPEYGLLEGIEVTTGPLGQGLANGVGMAIAQQYLAAHYNKPGFDIFNYHIYAICSDGDLMEGISAEAASIAGNLQLGNIIYLYDDNHITIEGDTSLTFSKEDVALRFEAYGWHVQTLPDANDIAAVEKAIDNAKKETQKPSLIKIRSHIAYGSPNKVDTKEAHGAPLGEQEVKLVKKNLGFNPDESFVVPGKVLNYYRQEGKKGVQLEKEWTELYNEYKKQYPLLAKEYELLRSGKLPDGWQQNLPAFKTGDKMATRKASGKVLNAIADNLPLLLGGSADLAPSTDTMLEKYPSFSATERGGRNFHFGIREHSMGAILNGMAVTKGFSPYGATFLIFSEYMRPPIRLAAIMKIRPIFIYTHDSIGLGEDGTTHQPVEQLVSLRSIPNLVVIRPADANETAQAWRVALEHSGGPVALVLTRQGLPVIDQEKYAKASGLEKGAYILSGADKPADIILIATGSEVSLVLKAEEMLEKEGITARVVSMPSWELFEKQGDDYKEAVFPKALRKRLAVEAGSPLGWLKYTTEDGDIIGITKFGESAPGEEVMKEYGFSPENVVVKAKVLLQK